MVANTQVCMPVIAKLVGSFVVGHMEGEGILRNQRTGEICEGIWKRNMLEGIKEYIFDLQVKERGSIQTVLFMKGISQLTSRTDLEYLQQRVANAMKGNLLMEKKKE